jgi:two-component system response regulator
MRTPAQILLVEDDPTSVDLIREALKDSGLLYDLTVTSDGETALTFLKTGSEKPQLILLDINLPKKSGLEVLKEIKIDPLLRAIPVIMLTSSSSQTDVALAYKYSCNAYVRKPLGFDKLVSTIETIGKFWFTIVTLPEGVTEPATPPPPPPPSYRAPKRNI